ncbi:MAG: SpaA isopeptide-forming pilin-related protein [Lachnospiraceae bacterium]|nr:SpaA isopeptide-forming pilin-related protein [Lachnospiraceae bacterium]
MGNQFSKKTRKKAGSIQAQRIFRSRWFKSLVAMGSAVVFFTVYSLIIPAATLTEDQAAADSGIVLEEPAPSEPQVVETEEAPAPEPAPEEAPKEEPVAQAAVEETPAAASEETAAQTPVEETGTAPSAEQGTSESAAAGSGSEETKDDSPADTADLNQTASAVDTTETASDGIETEESDAALTEEETAEDATTESSEESAEETTEEEEEIGTVSELKAASGNLEALVRFADGAGIPENASLVIYGAGADTGKVQDALWSGSMDSIERSSITTDLSEYVSFAVKDADGNDITPDSDCSIEISFGSEANLSDPGENRIRKYGSLVVGSDGNVSVTGTDLSTGNGHTYATFTGTLSGNTFGFAVTTADRKVNYLESLSGKTSDGAVEAALSFGKDAKVPEGSSLTVETASVNESSVLDKFWGDEEGVNRDTAKADDIRFVKFVIRDRNGNEVRPETRVSVKLTFHHEADLSEAAEGFVKKHNALAAGPDGTITLGSGALSAGNGITTVSFADVSAKSAFGYAVTKAEKKIVYATKLTGESEDGSIEASLRLTEEAKIPEGSILKVTPVTGESVQKTLLDNIWTDTSIIDPDTIKLTDSALATVTITDKDGNVRKPEADAELTLTFNKEADLAEAARKMVKRAKAVEMTEENVKLSDSGLSVAEGKTRISYTGIVDGQTFGYAVSTAKQKTNFLDGKLSYEGKDYTIEVSVSKDNQIPEGAALTVSELDSKSNEYQNKLDQAQEAILKEAQKKTSEDVEVALNTASAHLYDISLENENGEKIQPNGKVTVRITYDSAIQISKDESMQTVHFDENAGERQVLSTKVTEETSGDSKKVTALSFDTDGFSVYAVVGAAENYPDRLTYPAEDKAFTAAVAGLDVKVMVPAKSFKSEVSLKAAEQTWNDLTEDVQKQLMEQGVSAENSASIDLHFEDAEGTETEPAKQVSVMITTHKEDVVDAVTSGEGIVNVFHAEEAKDDEGSVQNVEVKQVASTEDNSVVTESQTRAKAEFEIQSFSIFTISWRNNGRLRAELTFHYVDANGNEITGPRSGNTNVYESNETITFNAAYAGNVNGYTYKRAYILVNQEQKPITKLKFTTISWYGYYSYEITYYNNDEIAKRDTVSGRNNTNRDIYFEYDNGEISVTFDANGGSKAAPEAAAGKLNDDIVLPSYDGVKEDYTFLGWTDTKNLEGDTTYHPVYSPGTTYTLKENTTLYAAWSRNSGGISRTDFFLRLSGTIPSEPGYYSTSEYTAGIEIDDNVNERRWIVDTGWNEIDAIHAKNSVTANLYTLPTAEQLVEDINRSQGSIGFTVKSNDGKIIVDRIKDKNKANGHNITNTGEELYCLWYVQKLQWTNSTVGNTWHIDGVLLVKSKVTVSYNKNTNDIVNNMPLGYQTANPTTITIGSSESADGPVLTPTRTGYTFEGWNTKPDGTGIAYSNGNEFVLKENTIFYAQWSKGYNRLTVNKQNMSGIVLSGAKFTLEERDDQNSDIWKTVSTGTTDGDGNYSYPNVRSQTIYRLTETYAPKGYLTRNSFCFKVTTGENSEILDVYSVDELGNKIQRPSWIEMKYEQADSSGGSAKIRLIMKDEQIKRAVIFKKIGDDDKALSGAQFALTDSANNTIDILAKESDQNGIFSTEDAALAYGEYTLTENKAPSHYYSNGPITISLNDPTGDAAEKDGTYTENTGMSFDGENASNASVSMTRATSAADNTTTYTYTVTIRNDSYAAVTFRKMANDSSGNLTNTALEGAVFTLTRQNAGGAYEVPQIEGLDSTGSFQITSKEGITFHHMPSGNYKLEETAAPDGYIVSKNAIYFKVTAGDVKLTDENFNQLASIPASMGITNDTTVLIGNTPGTALPNTGGPGTTQFIILGLLLIFGAGFGYIVLRIRTSNTVE